MNTVSRTDSRRPLGVTLIALLFLISSLLTLGALIVGLIEPSWVFSLHDALRGDILNARNHAVAHFVVAAIYAAMAMGLWRLQMWARLVVLFVTGASLFGALIGIVLGPAATPMTRPAAVGFLWFSAILSGVIVMYFNRTQVKVAFRKP